MHIRTISMKGGFPPDIGGVLTTALAQTQLRARELAEATVVFLKGVTPTRSGFMRSATTYWSLRVYSRGGFVFWFGWRSGDFLGKRAFYPPYVDKGTGIYNRERRRRIYPLKAKRLAWIYRGEWVSAKSVAGQRPQHLLKQAEKFATEKLRGIYQSQVLMGMKRTFK